MKYFTVTLPDSETRVWVFLYSVKTKTTILGKKYGTESFYETFKISRFRRNILLWHDQTQEHKFGCSYTTSAHKKYFKKRKYES